MRISVPPSAGVAARKNLHLPGRGQGKRYHGLCLHLYCAVLRAPPDGPLDQNGSGRGAQASPRLETRPPSGEAGDSQPPQRAELRRPQRERQVDLSQNGYLSLSLSPMCYGAFGVSLSLSLSLSLSIRRTLSLAARRKVIFVFTQQVTNCPRTQGAVTTTLHALAASSSPPHLGRSGH